MTVRFVSPGIRVTEIDKTSVVSDVENLNNVAAFVGPFERGPINAPQIIRSQKQLFETFGNPRKEDKQNRYWMSAVNYLSYGGVLSVTRIDSNASTGIGTTATYNTAYSNSTGSVGSDYLKIRNDEEYDSKRAASTLGSFVFAAKSPGSWGNNVTVAVIDRKSDEIIEVPSVSGITTGTIIKVDIPNTTSPDVAPIFAGFSTAVLVGKISAVNTSSNTVEVKIDAFEEKNNSSKSKKISYSRGSKYFSYGGIGIGATSLNVTFGSTQVAITSITSVSDRIKDWYSTQLIGKTGTRWESVISKAPSTSGYALGFNARNDEVHIAIIDNTGKIAQNTQGNQSAQNSTILEVYSNLSKASDGQRIPADDNYYLNVLRNNSKYIYAGESVINTISADTYRSGDELNYGDLIQQNSDYKSIGNRDFDFGKGTDAQGIANRFNVNVDEIKFSYNLYKNENYQADFILSGPGLANDAEDRLRANTIIDVVETRKDCIACISATEEILTEYTPTLADPLTKARKIVGFFASPGITRSNYAIFDAGCKYVYDQYNREYFYIPCSSDVAGLMARNALTNFSWNSPAGTTRGVLNNAIKLGYSPGQAERDELYAAGINPIINLPGYGALLYGDKTSTLFETAFNRINVRKLFLDVQKVIRNASVQQLFEFNNETTRANFVNSIDPYLRDVQAKNGILEYLIVCNETNNPTEIVDSNQFVADIYIKPARVINFIQLNFIATRTGVSFDEVIGTF
jgi:hypothetical protein